MHASRLLRAVIATALALTSVFVGVSAASAHSDTFSSIPAAGSTSANVSQIQFTFAEPVQKSMGPEMVLQNGEHTTIPTGSPTFDVTGATMTVPITTGALPNGNYTATYRVVSIDGHVASGVLSFTVAGSSAASIARDAASSSPISVSVTDLQQPNDVPVLTLILSVAAVMLILAAVMVVIVRRRSGKF